jgi:hypothetical protein
MDWHSPLALQLYFWATNTRMNDKPSKSISDRKHRGAHWVFIELLSWKYESTLKYRSQNHGQMEKTVNSTQGISWDTSWMTRITTNTWLSKHSLEQPFARFLNNPYLQFIVTRVTTWSQSFPFIGGQTSTRSQTANCSGAGNLIGGLGKSYE